MRIVIILLFVFNHYITFAQRALNNYEFFLSEQAFNCIRVNNNVNYKKVKFELDNKIILLVEIDSTLQFIKSIKYDFNNDNSLFREIYVNKQVYNDSINTESTQYDPYSIDGSKWTMNTFERIISEEFKWDNSLLKCYVLEFESNKTEQINFIYDKNKLISQIEVFLDGDLEDIIYVTWE